MTTNVKWKLSRYVTIGDFMPQWIQIIWYDKTMTSNFFWSVFHIPITWDVLWFADGTGSIGRIRIHTKRKRSTFNQINFQFHIHKAFDHIALAIICEKDIICIFHWFKFLSRYRIVNWKEVSGWTILTHSKWNSTLSDWMLVKWRE